MIGYWDRGVVLALIIVVAGGVLVVGAEPADDLFGRANAYGNREYALNAMALPYLKDFTDDDTLIRDTASMYWCWTPVVEQWDRIPEAEKSEVVLRARAKRLVARYVREPT